MKPFYFLSVFTLITGIAGLLSFEAAAAPKIINSGNAKAVGGNGGNAQGKGAKGGNGGAAVAKAGNINIPKGAIINSGNANAKGGNGGNAKGKGAKGGNGGDAVAIGGNIGKLPKASNPKAGGGGGGQANAGNANAKGGNGGNATGPGAKGGNGGDAIAVSGNGNTVINGDGNTVIGKVVNNNISLSFGGFGGGGFSDGIVTSGGGFGGGYYGDGAPGIGIASTPSETVITTDGSPAIATAQDGMDNVEEAERELVFTRRFLKVKNDSGVPMKVFLQYRGFTDKKWAWFPADPSESKDALTFDLMPGQEMHLEHKDKKLSASRVRIWGVAESQSWLDYRDQDLWVVPEMDQRGEHRYLATEMRTFTFVFPKQVKTESK